MDKVPTGRLYHTQTGSNVISEGWDGDDERLHAKEPYLGWKGFQPPGTTISASQHHFTVKQYVKISDKCSKANRADPDQIAP